MNRKGRRGWTVLILAVLIVLNVIFWYKIVAPYLQHTKAPQSLQLGGQNHD